MLVGDAAGTADPLLCEGISFAMMSALVAVGTLLEREAGLLSDLRPYDARLRRTLGPGFRRLSLAATLSSEATRRRSEEADSSDLRLAFQRDRDRILHARAFRRLKHKTQVFINPEGDHYVTRLTHTLQVTQIGRALARYLGLNEALAEAICLGHDVGHSPFGHTGEDALSEFVQGEWRHSDQSVRIFEVLEPLNLSWEVLDGIRAQAHVRGDRVRLFTRNLNDITERLPGVASRSSQRTLWYVKYLAKK